MLRSLLLASLVQGTQLGPDATAALSSAEGLDALAADLSLTSHGPHPTIDGALHQRLHTLELPGAGRATLAAEASKFRNREFMQAIVAACALMAAADGKISSEEKQKMMGYSVPFRVPLVCTVTEDLACAWLLTTSTCAVMLQV